MIPLRFLRSEGLAGDMVWFSTVMISKDTPKPSDLYDYLDESDVSSIHPPPVKSLDKPPHLRYHVNMNVLSLFDGISCGQLALQRAGIPVTQYFASEIDKHAIKVTQTNFPNTVQLGDVTKVKVEALPKIDLLIGGSPCQGFSFAGKLLNFEDPRSKLFFEFVRLLKETAPKWFLLENVLMKAEHERIITDQLGVKPVMIDSADFSAQSRKRLYWTNIPLRERERESIRAHGYRHTGAECAQLATAS